MTSTHILKVGATSLLLALSAGGAALADGVQSVDLVLPAAMPGLQSHAIAGDATALPPDRLRIYLISPAKPLADTGALARAINPGLAAVQVLSAITAEGDITTAAAQLGVTPPQFLPPPGASEKRLQPNRIFRYGPAHRTGYFVTFVAVDAPDAALTGSLHCRFDAPDGGPAYAQSLMSNLDPTALPGLVDALCQTAAKTLIAP